MLYEPTNIVPSTLTNTGAIDVNDNIEISWQVNGNSQLIGFRIDMFLNDEKSTPVGSTPYIDTTTGNSTPLPFYGRNSLGEIVRYTYAPNVKWNSANAFPVAINSAPLQTMTNNGHYKYRITQFYEGGNTAQTSYSALNTYTTPTISISLTNNSKIPFTSTLDTSIFNAVGNYAQAQGVNIQSVRWQLYENGTLIDDTGAIDTADLAYQYSGAQNGFEYRLVCTVISESGQVPTPAEQTFTVHYDTEHAGDGYQSDFTAQCVCNDDSVLMSWNRLPSEQIIIPGDNEGGYSVNSQNQLILPEGASVTWDKVQKAGETAQPMDFDVPWTAVWRGKVDFLPKINLSATLTEVQNVGSVSGPSSSAVAYSPDGSLLVIGGNFANYTAIYSISNGAYTYRGYVSGWNGDVNTIAFTPDGNYLLIGGSSGAKIFDVNGYVIDNGLSIVSGDRVDEIIVSLQGDLVFMTGTFTGYIAYYTLSGKTLSNRTVIRRGNTSFSDEPTGIAYSSTNGVLLAIETVYSGTPIMRPRSRIYQFNFENTTYSYVGEVLNNGTAFENNKIVSSVTFSPNGNMLIVNGNFTNAPIYYTVSGQTITYRGTAPIDYGNGSDVNSFSTDGRLYLHIYTTYDYPGSLSQANIAIYFLNGENFDYFTTIKTGIESTAQGIAFNNSSSSVSIVGHMPAQVYEIDYTDKDFFILQSNNINIFYNYPAIVLKDNTGILETIKPDSATDEIVLCLTPQNWRLYELTNGEITNTQVATITYTQPTITSVTLTGEQTTDYFAIIDGDGSDISENLSNPNFEFQWNNGNQYTLDMLANFSNPANRLDAGTGSVSNNGFMLYRHDGNNNKRRELIRIIDPDVGQIKDYGLRSNEEYDYTFYAYDKTGAFIGQTPATIPARQFHAYSLLATQYSATDGCYHVYKEFRFGANVQNMSVSNNANSSYVQNFTPYPTRQYSSANYKSGTLQALIGFVDQEANRYFDDTKLMDELYALSTADFTLFLRDLKGNLYMIAPNGAITMTPNNKTAAQEVTISFPWVEIGDASQVSIIQLPTDAGWNNDAQLLDVKLGIDFATGELIVTYPYPYYGTKFNYTKQTGQLRTTTPADVTPRTVTLDTEPSSATSGAVIADPDNLQGGGES